MIKITSIDQLRVGGILKEVCDHCYYLLEVYAEGGRAQAPSFTAKLIYCSDERGANVGKAALLYPNKNWFGIPSEEFYVINR